MKKAFKQGRKGEKIRHLGGRLNKFCRNEYYQYNLFDFNNAEKQRKLNTTSDTLRNKYDKQYVIRSTFLHSGIKPKWWTGSD